jgi:hypothetical protein
MSKQKTVSRNEALDGPVAIKDKMNSGRKENNERVLGLASAWQHSSR